MTRLAFPLAAILLVATLPAASALDPTCPPACIEVNRCPDIVVCSIQELPLPDDVKIVIIAIWLGTKELICTRTTLDNPGVGLALEEGHCEMLVSPHPPGAQIGLP